MSVTGRAKHFCFGLRGPDQITGQSDTTPARAESAGHCRLWTAAENALKAAPHRPIAQMALRAHQWLSISGCITKLHVQSIAYPTARIQSVPHRISR